MLAICNQTIFEKCLCIDELVTENWARYASHFFNTRLMFLSRVSKACFTESGPHQRVVLKYNELLARCRAID
jgi:hypothetical protein